MTDYDTPSWYNFKKSVAKVHVRDAKRKREIQNSNNSTGTSSTIINPTGLGPGFVGPVAPRSNLGRGGARRVKGARKIKYPGPATTTKTMRKVTIKSRNPLATSNRRLRRRTIFPTKRKAGRAQRIVSTITPTRSLTYQFNGVVDGQNINTAGVQPGVGVSPTPFSSAEFAYGATTPSAVPSQLCGIFGNVAQDKADPGCNAWFFQTLFHGSQIDQLSQMCMVNSDAPAGGNPVVGTNLNRNRRFYISGYTVTHTLHNPTSTPIYINRYEIVPRVNLKNVSDLLYGMQHFNTRGDYAVDVLGGSTGLQSYDRSYGTPDCNPHEFPMWRARFRVVKKTRFCVQPGQSIECPFAGKLNKKIDMDSYSYNREATSTAGVVPGATIDVWGTDATYMQKGLTKILCYQAFGIPAVQGVTDDTLVGSALSNRVTTTPPQFIVRSTMKIRAHGAVDTARRYASVRLADNLETATSAVSGVAGSTTHSITVTNQI